MDQQEYTISFDQVSSADANRYASDLQEALLDAAPGITVDRRRANPDTQDFGATLALLAGTPAVLALAQAIGNWLQAHHQVELTVKRPDGTEIVLTNATSKDAKEMANTVFRQQ